MGQETAQNEVKSRKFSGVFPVMLSVVLIGFSGMLVLDSIKSINLSYNRSLLLDQARGEVDELRMRNLELGQSRDDVISEGYVEQESRDRLFYTKEGEVMVVLPETEEVAGEGDENVDTVTEFPEQSSGWEQWWGLLRDGI